MLLILSLFSLSFENHGRISLRDTKEQVDLYLTVLQVNPAKNLYEKLAFVTYKEENHRFNMKKNPHLRGGSFVFFEIRVILHDNDAKEAQCNIIKV